MIKLYICCLVLIIGSVEVGPDIDMKFHQKVMEIVSYDTYENSEHFYHTGITLSYNHLRRHKIKVKMKEKKRLMIGCGNHIEKPN